jgi:hypothetical protein
MYAHVAGVVFSVLYCMFLDNSKPWLAELETQSTRDCHFPRLRVLHYLKGLMALEGIGKP